ncbi:hypothetical protein GCM10027448_08860 [Nocardioides dilutus]
MSVLALRGGLGRLNGSRRAGWESACGHSLVQLRVELTTWRCEGTDKYPNWEELAAEAL